ncbi:hydroxymethylglutaryl-CoA reductase [Lactobacillus xylocopicola]|uniref:Hydroxymethylglutaryl-CoA reductase n=1 Tax=Lactobacillus xylocopicola TaxID=2976676 RepID=A0ABN6SKL4_9LACO|nr:hydroxymethylglutaryl-CoA reductase [Lactobacillus xylocopicola]BDR60198.1 hydroxymethylglutaryl-CoA reductase [Lactobacillus xylocopicola]
MKFYELSPAQRRAWLAERGIKLDEIDPAILHELDHLSENVVGQLRLPVGIVPQIVVNGRNYIVPMATEETSVVAAANHGASLFARGGGVEAVAYRDGIYGQVILQVDENFKVADLEQAFPDLIAQTNDYFASLVRHGGGVRTITVHQQGDLVYLKVLIDPAEAMGANRANAILEYLALKLADYAGVVSKLFAILSNYPSQFTKAEVSLNVKTVGGIATAKRIALLSQLGQDDPYRAVTNNKGIMNGIDAVLLSTGNDTRAVEAACGVWASHHGKYGSLSKWWLEGDLLVGQLVVPLAIGTVGGSINARKDVQENYQILGQGITSSELAGVVAAIGLANNLAALHAIATAGIQAGHMKLQARNIAASLTDNQAERAQLVKELVDMRIYTQSAAEAVLKQIREEK